MRPKFFALNGRDDLYFFTVIILALLHTDMSAVSRKPETSSWGEHNIYLHTCQNLCVIWASDEILAKELFVKKSIHLSSSYLTLFNTCILQQILLARCSKYFLIGSSSSLTHFQDGLSVYDPFIIYDIFLILLLLLSLKLSHVCSIFVQYYIIPHKTKVAAYEFVSNIRFI